MTPDFKARTISGKSVLRFKPIARPLDELKLDGVDLRVRSVTATEKLLGWQATDKQRIYAAEFGTKQNVQVSADTEGKCGFPSLAAGGDVIGVAYETPTGISFRSVGR